MRDMPDGVEAQPHNVEAEQQLLGAMLLDNTVIDKTADLIKADQFFDPVHADIYEAIRSRVDGGQLASPVVLKSVFENHEGMRQLGGTKYLAKLATVSAVSRAVRSYATIISDLAAKRQIIAGMVDAKAAIAEGKAGSVDIAASLETAVGAIMATSTAKPLTRSHLSCVIGLVKNVGAAMRGDDVPGFPTRLPQVDTILDKFGPGKLYVLAGRPGMAKTSVAQNLAMMAMDAGRGVFHASLEMDGEECASRYISLGLSRRGVKIPYNRFTRTKDGKLSEMEARAVLEEAKRQEGLPLEIAERDVRTGPRLRSAIRRTQQRMANSKFPLGLVVIDYLQLLQFADNDSPYVRASKASDLCKSISLEFSLPVIACAQLSRGVEQRDSPFPKMSDLRDSGKLEEDADVVMLLYRQAYYTEQALASLPANAPADTRIELEAELDATRDTIDLVIEKHRGGRTGKASAFIDLACCHLTSDRGNGGYQR